MHLSWHLWRSFGFIIYRMIKLIAFDADDTLWHNETLYQATKESVMKLLAGYAPAAVIEKHLDAVEMRNLKPFGYGAKAFILSLIETAIEVSGGQVRADEIQQIIQYGKGMLNSETQVFSGVEPTLDRLSRRCPLMLLTKGDLLDQEAKLARSGLAQYFTHIEIVSNKTVETYQRILKRHHLAPTEFLMVGNALKSDILPVIQLGGWAVYIPFALTWAHEMKIEQEIKSEHFIEIERIDLLPAVVDRIGIK